MVVKYNLSGKKQLGLVKLPRDYFLGGNGGFCNLHNHGQFVWSGMRGSYFPKQPAVAVEFDMAHDKIIAMVGAGHLHTPIAAYYGNGYVP